MIKDFDELRVVISFQMTIFRISIICLCFAEVLSLSIRRPIPLGQFPSATKHSFQFISKDGSYRFGMQGQDQWRVEERYPNGKVYVRFAYRTPDGQVIDNSFSRGYQSKDEALRTDTKVKSAVNDVHITSLEVDSSLYSFEPDFQPKVYNINENQHQTSVAKDDRIKPYGALSSTFQSDYFNSKAIIDHEIDAVVTKLV